MKSLYKSPESKKAILALYQDKLDELQLDYQYKSVPTSFGQSNVVITGNATNPPLVLVHGSNGCAPIALEMFPNLNQKYQVFAVDVIAQPNKSAETRPSMKDLSYGKWLNEVITALGLADVILAGFSFGGLVIWKTLLEDERKIKKAFMMMPAGIVAGNPLKAIFKVFIPMKRYQSSKNTKYIHKFLDALFSYKDDFAFKFLSKVFLDFEMDFSPIPNIKAKDAKTITTPITMIGADKDIFFPGKALLKRSKKIFPSLKDTLLLQDSKHVQNKRESKRIEDLILNASTNS